MCKKKMFIANIRDKEQSEWTQNILNPNLLYTFGLLPFM